MERKHTRQNAVKKKAEIFIIQRISAFFFLMKIPRKKFLFLYLIEEKEKELFI